MRLATYVLLFLSGFAAALAVTRVERMFDDERSVRVAILTPEPVQFREHQELVDALAKTTRAAALQTADDSTPPLLPELTADEFMRVAYRTILGREKEHNGGMTFAKRGNAYRWSYIGYLMASDEFRKDRLPQLKTFP